ncbi:methyl-accepting chemotaxis protein [Noviherbaspirillum pedocola]|uniref:Cache domain-containing protein n=1 Tax=Noviherbaspirillum pedocola TaxID=2801341 RepID=A0A934STU4_9BURK|nr:methyl-accepting chemotaxis protein [Noviherbaspirillum pedocola]MBK4735335.1 cache domain-containing protein [Noviherbaspirillum pedocola]
MKLTFRKKLFLPLFISWLCLLGISSFNVMDSKARRFEERQLALKFATDAGMSTVKRYASLADSGKMPLDEAKKRALDELRAMRYGKDGYYTIIDSTPRVVMHPIKPEMDGKDMSDFKDKAGTPLYMNVAKIAKTTGEGWVDYVWPKPGDADQNRVYPKGAYVATFKPWDWSFISGLYIDDLTDAFVRDLWQAALLLAVVGVALTAVMLAVIRSLGKSLGGDPEDAATVARSISAGDLGVAVPTAAGDEASLMAAMKSMRDNLSSIVGEVRTGADAIASAARQIAAGNTDLSDRTERQAGSLEETASSMEELAATVKQNADNARQANGLALSASEIAIRGGEVVGEVITTMASINESSKRIVDIISVIDGIAFQTNILALNAAVEAARAGEQGRGFAVVATEVRSLAQRSASAAKEIKALIGDSVEKVDAGGKLVDQAGATMQEIVSSVRRVADIIGEISAATGEQTAGIDEINGAIGAMDQVTQQNAALVEEAAAASQAMQHQAERLVQVVNAFRSGETVVTAAVAAPMTMPALGRSAMTRTSANLPASRTQHAALAARKLPAASAGATGADWEEF